MSETKDENISELQFVKGIGPFRAKALAKEGISSAYDLMNFFPRDYIHRDRVDSIKALEVKLRQVDSISLDDEFNFSNLRTEVTVIGQIVDKEERRIRANKKMLKLKISDGKGSAMIVFWSYVDYFSKIYKEGQTIIVSGQPELSYNRIQFTHPEIEKFDSDDATLISSGGILPVYRLPQSFKNAKISMKILRQAMSIVLDKVIDSVKETLPDYIIEKYHLPDRRESIRNLHFPKTFRDVSIAKKRMKFEEILFFELMLIAKRKKIKTVEKSYLINPKSQRARELVDSLPFELTRDQKKVLREIAEDLQSGKPMNRLLQGDVGSGKTIVAILSMLMAIDNGCQTALMVPTEILAEQHYHSLSNFLKDMDIDIVQLLGGQRVKVRRKILEEISEGKANIIVGTHAMFQSDIVYNNLGLIVIDEQHRFGVAQRSQLMELGKQSNSEGLVPHIIVMSATPIPRTLSLTAYGDLDISIINEKPKNRKPIITKVVFENQMPSVYDFIKDQLKEGKQAYIVYPLVEKSDKLELKAATEQFEKIKNDVFKEFKCGLLHGQMFWYEKEDAMKSFLNKEFDVLVATTVIEVGIDVTNATIMLIENAERFGLSQLHQLRGRVGRGSEQSYCFLNTKDNFQYEIRKNKSDISDRKAVIVRLKTMEETDDGFKIAEVDLKLRGPGDLMGTRQAGLPSFRFIDIVNDTKIIEIARKEAESIIDDDPKLKKTENILLRKEIIKQYKENPNYFDTA